MDLANSATDIRVLDLSRLSGMSQLREYEDDPFGEMTTLFCQHSTTFLTRAGLEAARRDGLALADTARAIESSATLIGAERMARAAAALEVAARNGRFDVAPALVARVARAFEATRAALRYAGAGRRES